MKIINKKNLFSHLMIIFSSTNIENIVIYLFAKKKKFGSNLICLLITLFIIRYISDNLLFLFAHIFQNYSHCN